MIEELAIPVLTGRKTASERFAGAINTLTCEAMMRDGKALQMGTSHELGQNFAKAFDITFLDDQGTEQTCWTTSWGVSTRMMGGLIMAHGDDAGLRVPPRIAATQVVVMVVRDDDAGGVDRGGAPARCRARATPGVRTRLDANVSVGFGRRATDWELKGVPIRIEIGPRDLEQGVATVVRRDEGEKVPLDLAGLVGRVAELLEEMQRSMLAEATARRDGAIVDVATIDEAVEAAATGFARLPWSLVGAEGEAKLAASAITVRCLQTADGGVPDDDEAPDLVAYVGRSY